MLLNAGKKLSDLGIFKTRVKSERMRMRYIFTSTNIFWSSASDANLEDKNLDEAVSGGQKTKRHRSQQGSNDCEALTDENVEVEVVREGQSKASHAKGFLGFSPFPISLRRYRGRIWGARA